MKIWFGPNALCPGDLNANILFSIKLAVPNVLLIRPLLRHPPHTDANGFTADHKTTEPGTGKKTYSVSMRRN